MRLIDADELRKNVLKWMPSDPCGKEEKEFPFETDICASMVMEIDDAPTVQPDTTAHESIPAETGKNDGDGTSGDCISRQAAIDALKEKVFHNLSDEFYGAMQVLDELPSVQPERKTGRWIEDAETYYKAVNEKGGGVNENTPYFTDCIACSECLSMFSVIDNETERFDFCPNCGADMRGKAEPYQGVKR